MSMSPVVNFSDVSRADVALVGGKDASAGGIIAALQKQGGLTRREAEVLLCVSYRNATKTISEILGISQRTVNKHLEQVFRNWGRNPCDDDRNCPAA